MYVSFCLTVCKNTTQLYVKFHELYVNLYVKYVRKMIIFG